MKQTLDKVARFMKMDVHFIPSENEEALFEGETFEIYDDEEAFIAACVLDEAGKLVNFHRIDIFEQEDAYGKGNLTSKEMPQVAESYIKAFYPHGTEDFTLQSVVDLDELYIISYGVADDKYGLELPGIGFSLTISNGGDVVQFYYDNERPHVHYPATIISEQEARDKYASLIDFDLVIEQTDTETFVNGDDTYRLVYSLREAAFDIPASGEEPSTISEGNEYEPVCHKEKTALSFHEFIGLTKDHVLLAEQTDEQKKTEKWIHKATTRPEEVDFTADYSEQMITIHYDCKTNAPIFVYNGVQWRGDLVKLDESVLAEQAHAFLFNLFPRADEHFLRIIEETDEDEMYEADYEEEEPEADDDFAEEMIDDMEEESVSFIFQYQKNKVPVEDKVTCIQVGIYSGNIMSASIELVDEALLGKVVTEPTLSKREAIEQFMRALRMELSMSLEYDEEGEPFYHVIYLPSFPETTGHVRIIDAENGKAYYVDVGDTTFF